MNSHAQSQFFWRLFRPDVKAENDSSLTELTLLTLLAAFAPQISGLHVKLLKILSTKSGTCMSSFVTSIMVKYSYFLSQSKCNSSTLCINVTFHVSLSHKTIFYSYRTTSKIFSLHVFPLCITILSPNCFKSFISSFWVAKFDSMNSSLPVSIKSILY